MEQNRQTDPDYSNVVFIDEYPELAKRAWLRRLNTDRRIGQLALFPKDPAQILLFPERHEGLPDGAA